MAGQFVQLVVLFAISAKVFSISYRPLIRLSFEAVLAALAGGVSAYFTLVFVVDGINGFTFQSKHAQSLKNVLLNIIESSDETLLSMSELSTHFANRITPSTSAQNLLSLCQK